MKAYGLDAMRSKGCKYAEDDVCTKGWFHGTGKHQSKRRRNHQRIYKKIQRAHNKQELRTESRIYTEQEDQSHE